VGAKVKTIRDELDKPWPAWYRYDGTFHNEIEAACLMTTWDLSTVDIALEVGTYEGAWAAAVAESGCIVHTFEPATRARTRAYETLRAYQNVTLWPYAIGGTDRQDVLRGCTDDGASFWQRDGASEGCTVVSLNHFLVHNRIGDVALLHLNCEGAEFEILEQAIEKGIMPRIQWLMAQWHGWEFDRKASICERLAKTHRMLWNYSYVEAWERKQDNG
jgi:FkbM family methyltransferase